jgi:hypothetical protein
MKELQRGDGERRDVFFFKMTTFIATLAPWMYNTLRFVIGYQRNRGE